MSARLLVNVLRRPETVTACGSTEWNGLVAAARAERLLATLAHRLERADVPRGVRAVMADAVNDAQREQRMALWEADRAREALHPLGIPVILLKGAAYVAAGLKAGEGRMIGDLDILVPRDRLEEAEALLLAEGWEWVKSDPYDSAYYRRWMHELPPLIHRERDRMIDVHHTILPLTARVTPDAPALISNSVEIAIGLRVLSPEDRVCHALAHMLADGDLTGGLRNLWDIRCLLADVRDNAALEKRALLHGLAPHLARARRLAEYLFADGNTPLTVPDRLYVRRLLSRDTWGRERHPITRFAFYIRSHLLRMPPGLLLRHLWTKWRKGHRPS